MKKMRGFEVDHIEKKVVCSKSFLRKASQYGTEEYKAFVGIERDFSSYKVMTAETKKAKTKMSMKGLSREFMEHYITTRFNEDAPDYIDFMGLKKMAQDEEGKYLPNTYMKMRKWFVDKYPDWDGKDSVRSNAKKEKAEEKQRNAKATYAAIYMADDEKQVG